MELEFHRLQSRSGFMNPKVLRVLSGYPSYDSEVAADGTVSIEGELYTGCPFSAGTKVKVRASFHIECCEQAAWEAELVRRAEIERQRDIADRERRIKIMEDAKAFNASLKLPFKWDVARRDVLSGLSANSWGDGSKSNTVHHILLLEPFTKGRLKRDTGHHLCSGGKIGKNWSASNTRPDRHAVDSEAYMPKVTCVACLRAAERIIKSEKN